MKNKCPVCESNDIINFLRRKEIPVIQNVPFKSAEEAKKINKRSMDMCFCEKCEFIFNASFEGVNYEEGYINSQEFSDIFKAHIENIIRKICKKIIGKFTNNNNLVIVEIGCGQGSFLKKIVNNIKDNSNLRIRAYGFDPAYAGEEYCEEILFKKEYFTETSFDNIEAENVVVIARHVIEHIENPKDFAQMVFKNIRKVGNGLLVLETPMSDWIINREAFEDFCYEHCSYFNEKSLKYLLTQNYFNINEFEVVFNNQYMLASCDFDNEKKNYILEYADNDMRKIDEWKKKLKSLKMKKQKIAIWGGGAKGVIFANLLDPKKEYISAVIDINPYKQGKYIAGTGHEILGIKALKQLNLDNIIVMNENYYEEIKESIEKLVNKSVKVIKL